MEKEINIKKGRGIEKVPKAEALDQKKYFNDIAWVVFSRIIRSDIDDKTISVGDASRIFWAQRVSTSQYNSYIRPIVDGHWDVFSEQLHEHLNMGLSTVVVQDVFDFAVCMATLQPERFRTEFGSYTDTSKSDVSLKLWSAIESRFNEFVHESKSENDTATFLLTLSQAKVFDCKSLVETRITHSLIEDTRSWILSNRLTRPVEFLIVAAAVQNLGHEQLIHCIDPVVTPEELQSGERQLQASPFSLYVLQLAHSINVLRKMNETIKSEQVVKKPLPIVRD